MLRANHTLPRPATFVEPLLEPPWSPQLEPPSSYFVWNYCCHDDMYSYQVKPESWVKINIHNPNKIYIALCKQKCWAYFLMHQYQLSFLCNTFLRFWITSAASSWDMSSAFFGGRAGWLLFGGGCFFALGGCLLCFFFAEIKH